MAAETKMSADHNDAIKLLKAVLDFKLKNNGATPTPTTANQVHDFIKEPLFTPLTDKAICNKLRNFKRRYAKATKKGEDVKLKFGREFLDLYKKIWGDKVNQEDKEEERNEKSEKKSENIVLENGKKEKSKKRKAETNLPENTPKKKEKVDKVVVENNKKEDDDEDDDDKEEEEEEEEDDDEEKNDNDEKAEDGDEDCMEKYKTMIEQVRNYWDKEGMCVGELERGLRHMDRAKAAALEKKWRKHLEAVMRVELNGHRLEVDLISLVLGKEKKCNGNHD